MRIQISIKSSYYLILLLVIILQSCATFDKELLNTNPLHKENLSTLNGSYHIISIKDDSLAKKWNSKSSLQRNNFLKEIDRKELKDTLKIDSLKTYSVELEVLNPKQLQINYIENGRVFRERIIKTKLKKDGYLYLKNKNVQPVLIPYVMGAISIKKTRITKSIEGNLIFDANDHRSGAAFLIMFLGWNRTKYRLEYQPFKSVKNEKENI
ncbi:hypothetical protein [Nonlabens ulvanivorans]|uniref:hypothetical protein n=1 Tax=Nonlabens ulvanivorans TaxID=906888 RepID=UPI002943008E|nr:hypothetical protein [Nonlabens ulvanivorans]WOI23860.1 hypothetical protein R1T42_05225 [Nonlabens ulvanivorans]